MLGPQTPSFPVLFSPSHSGLWDSKEVGPFVQSYNLPLCPSDTIHRELKPWTPDGQEQILNGFISHGVLTSGSLNYTVTEGLCKMLYEILIPRACVEGSHHSSSALASQLGWPFLSSTV